eukprot:COSAG05_NODE_23350_length_258_cov_1.295597_1_plen_33_part_10
MTVGLGKAMFVHGGGSKGRKGHGGCCGQLTQVC